MDTIKNLGVLIEECSKLKELMEKNTHRSIKSAVESIGVLLPGVLDFQRLLERKGEAELKAFLEPAGGSTVSRATQVHGFSVAEKGIQVTAPDGHVLVKNVVSELEISHDTEVWVHEGAKVTFRSGRRPIRPGGKPKGGQLDRGVPRSFAAAVASPSGTPDKNPVEVERENTGEENWQVVKGKKKGNRDRKPGARRGVSQMATVGPAAESGIEKRAVPTKILEVSGGQFSDMVRSIRQLEAPKAEIKSIRKTKNGKLEIKLVGEDQEVKSAIEGVNGLVVATKTKMSYIVIKDLDNLAVKEEIEEALSKNSNHNREDFEVKSLRPAYGDSQRAVARIPTYVARRLEEVGRIQVGWVRCRVSMLATLDTCFKCGGVGHKAHTCDGPDQRKCCFKCGEEGHRMATCVKPWCCNRCGEEHRSGYCRHK